MGWFSSDEFVTSSTDSSNSDLIAAIALAVIALIALMVVLAKIYHGHLKRQVETTMSKNFSRKTLWKILVSTGSAGNKKKGDYGSDTDTIPFESEQ